MTAGPDTVILVHGLWMHGIAMELLRRRLARSGLRALAYSYPSMRLTLAQNVERLTAYCRGLAVSRLHFAAHSLGGLIVLRLFERAHGLAFGRAVLLGTPCAGSHAGRKLARLPGGRAVLGRSLVEWLEPPRALPAVNAEVGVIAGRLGLGAGRLVAPALPAPNDGVVSVEETRLPGARDHIVLPVSHSGMLVSRAVAHQVCAFLRNGAFDRAKG